MMLQIEFWQLVSAIVSLIVTFASMMWLFGTLLVKQFKNQLDERFKTIKDELDKNAQQESKITNDLRDIERSILVLQKDLPIMYVRREDYIRGQTVIESKIDAVMSKLELVQIQGAKHDR